MIKPLGISITEAARRLRVLRVALSRVLNEGAGISAEMAVRLGRALDSDAELWLRIQVAYPQRSWSGLLGSKLIQTPMVTDTPLLHGNSSTGGQPRAVVSKENTR